MEFPGLRQSVDMVGNFLDQLAHLSVGETAISDLPNIPCEGGYMTKSSARFISFIAFNSHLTRENFDDCYACVNILIQHLSSRAQMLIASILKKYIDRMRQFVDIYGLFNFILQLFFAVRFHPGVQNHLRRSYMVTIVETAVDVIIEKMKFWRMTDFETLDGFARTFFGNIPVGVNEVPFECVVAAYRFTFSRSN